jgi:polar amino acid transport system substrate-binding protein
MIDRIIGMGRIFTAGVVVAGLLSATAANAGKLEDIQKAGVIRVGIALTGEPIGFRDAENKPVGYDVDVAQRLADSLGVKLQITEVSGAVRITMLQSGQIDVVVANMTATLERARAVDFSITYLRSGIKLLTREGTGVTSMADLKGKKVIVGRGTTGEAMIKREVPGAELVYTEAFAPEAILLLQQKRADAAIEDSTLVDYAALKNPGLIALPNIYTSDPEAIGVAKGDLEFVRYLDMFVSNYISSGAYQANYKKWFGQEGPALTALW